MSDKELKVDPTSIPYLFGEIKTQLVAINRRQNAIGERLNNQNGQISTLAGEVGKFSEVIKGLQCWRQEQEKDEKEAKEAIKEKRRGTIGFRAAIYGGIVTAVLSSGLTAILYNIHPLG